MRRITLYYVNWVMGCMVVTKQIPQNLITAPPLRVKIIVLSLVRRRPNKTVNVSRAPPSRDIVAPISDSRMSSLVISEESNDSVYTNLTVPPNYAREQYHLVANDIFPINDQEWRSGRL